MPYGVVNVRIHETDDVTWETLSKVFPVKSADTSTWVELADPETGISVTFFKRGLLAPDELAEPEEAEPVPTLPAA